MVHPPKKANQHVTPNNNWWMVQALSTLFSAPSEGQGSKLQVCLQQCYLHSLSTLYNGANNTKGQAAMQEETFESIYAISEGIISSRLSIKE